MARLLDSETTYPQAHCGFFVYNSYMIEPIEMKCFYCGVPLIRRTVVYHATCFECRRKHRVFINRKYRLKNKKQIKVKKPKKIKVKEIDLWAKYRPKSFLGITLGK